MPTKINVNKEEKPIKSKKSKKEVVESIVKETEVTHEYQICRNDRF